MILDFDFVSSITGYPVNSFEFFGNLLKSLDYELPKFCLALPYALFIGRIFSVFYSLLYPWLNKWWLPQPLMLPTEVYKVCLNVPILLAENCYKLFFGPCSVPGILNPFYFVSFLRPVKV